MNEITLVVEQDSELREHMVDMLRTCGCHPIAVPSAERAVGLLTQMKFDFLVAGITSESLCVNSLILDATNIQPSLTVALGGTFIAQCAHTWRALYFMNIPPSLDQMRAIVRSAFHRAVT